MRKLIAEGETVMDLIKENENLIHCLKELRDELKIEELEKAIRNQEFNDTSYEELIYKKNQELLIEPCDETIENISKEEQELLMLYRKCTPSKRHLLKVYLQMLTQFQEKF